MKRRAGEPSDPPPPGRPAVSRAVLELAEEIQREIDRVVNDPSSDAYSLIEVVELVPQRERSRVVREIFDQLPPDVQWAVVEKAFGDDEIRTYLADERQARLSEVRRSDEHDALVRRARAERRLDTVAIPPNEHLRLGLFRGDDVRAAMDRGPSSATCARQLVLRSEVEPGQLRVIDDVFNPLGGLFVTAEYDRTVWERERLTSHAIVRVGSIVDDDASRRLDPVIYPGARLDVEVGTAVLQGHLHVGFAILGTSDVFAG